MDLQRIIALVKMELKKVVREPAYLFLLILFPVVLTITFGITFSGGFEPTLSLGMNFPNILTLTLGINLPYVENLPNMVLTITYNSGTSDLTYGINLPNSIPINGSSSEIGMGFNAMVPGLFAYGCIFIIMIVSMSFANDRKEGLLRRLNMTPMTSGEFMGSHIISKMLIAILQVLLIFVSAILVGFKTSTGVSGILLAFCVMAIFSLSSVGLGLITATIAKTPEIAIALSFVFILPQMFLGTFVPLNESTRMIAIFLPSYYATDAIKTILKGGMLISLNILVDFAFLSIVSVVIVIIGIQLFKKFGNV